MFALFCKNIFLFVNINLTISFLLFFVAILLALPPLLVWDVLKLVCDKRVHPEIYVTK